MKGKGKIGNNGFWYEEYLRKHSIYMEKSSSLLERNTELLERMERNLTMMSSLIETLCAKSEAQDREIIDKLNFSQRLTFVLIIVLAAALGFRELLKLI